MKFQRLFYIVAVILAAMSCKKDEDTAMTPSLDGYISIHGLPEYISVNDRTHTMTPKGAVHPEGEDLGYYWKVTPTMTKYDTTRYTNGLDKPDASGQPSDGSFTHTFSDTLKTYTVYCYAFADGYSTSSASRSTTVVKGGKDGSIKGIAFPAESISTEYGTYYYKTIGTQTWIVNNICEKSSGSPFVNSEAMSDVFGRYYSYEQAIAVCASLPGGNWKLPSKEDWETLENVIDGEINADDSYAKSVAAALMVDATFNGEDMWEYWPAVGDITNSSGFSAIPAGYAVLPSGSFSGLNEYSMFWTSSESSEKPGMAYCKYLISTEPDIFTREADKTSFGASVRCIRE